MNRVDHNGKVYRSQVHKHQVASIIQTTGDRIRGVLFHDPEHRLKDTLNDRDEDFIAIIDAEFLSEDGAVIDHCEFLAVNKRHIEWVKPADSVLDHKRPFKGNGK